MRRPYSPSVYAAVVERLAAEVPGICIGADVMTGFPGETADDHRATVTLVESLPLSYLHVFPFSPRPGTVAAAMPEQVEGGVARERARELYALSARRFGAFAAAQCGRDLEVAVERLAQGSAAGTARNYLSVRWPCAGERRGDLVRVRVEAAEGEVCLGRRAKDSERRV
jgi:threonylcarbamoyladenosine tRNA methylthiotransferase MtaB